MFIKSKKINLNKDNAQMILDTRSRILKEIEEIILIGSNNDYTFENNENLLTMQDTIRCIQSRHHFTLTQVEKKRNEILHFLKKVKFEVWVESLYKKFCPDAELSLEEFATLFITPLIFEGKVELNELKDYAYMENWHISYTTRSKKQ